jgi:GNAT superfamily N-acetyltransferase
VEVRIATAEDLDGVAETLTLAFESDPLWSWAFPRREDLAVWWRFYVRSALRYPWVLIAGDYEAAASWIPPGGTELTDEEEAAVEPLLRDLIGARTAEVMDLLDRFERAHPEGEPHYYLSLLGTHPGHRGKGVGMSLLAESLDRIDAEGAPAYLESSNAANDSRYERHGFVRIGQFTRPDERVAVSTMWRGPA